MADDSGFPTQLRKKERELLDRWRDGELRSKVGLGLSGGGVRSATFGLGVLQALARSENLRRFGYLSTVSGGGYIGSFLGRLFHRQHIEHVGDVEDLLAQRDDGASFRWLRENGRYLAPQGGGDLLLGGAVLMRNWVAMMFAVALPLWLMFLAAQLVRAGLGEWMAWVDFPLVKYGDLEGPYHEFASTALVWSLPGAVKLWASPYFLLVPLVVLLLAVPLGWAYWLVRSKSQSRKRSPHNAMRLVGMLVVLAGVGTFLAVSELGAVKLAALSAMTGVVGLLALVAAGVSLLVRPPEAVALPRDEVEGWNAKARRSQHWLSRRLAAALVLTAALVTFALIDSLGQTAYAIAWDPESTIKTWAVAVLGGFTGLASLGRWFAVSRSDESSKRPKWWTSALALLVAVLIAVLSLSLLNTASHAVAWWGKAPADAPTGLAVAPVDDGAQDAAAAATDEPATKQTSAPTASTVPPQRRAWLALAWVGGGVLLVVLVLGRSWPFVNRSSHLPLYAARLTRAYQGASNPYRIGKKGTVPLTNVIHGDDITMADYWLSWGSDGSDGGALGKGAPLHLVNVTINETLDGRSQVQQQDRKGVGMAIGPAGISAGVRHHVVFAEDPKQPFSKCKVFPAPGSYRMFDYPGDEFGGEALTLGDWVGVSGAAFSTGLGSRTSLGLSLLAGFANVRLGYWWDSGIRRRGARRGWFEGAVRSVVPVYAHIFDEYTARFHGSALRHWYLSDGGHFENMGGYELIRRRLRAIVIVDAEADPTYRFEGLANLIRKARVDFDTKIIFLDRDELPWDAEDEWTKVFGSLDDLRPRDPDSDDPPDQLPRSRASAALARIRYPDGGDGWLIYIKPTIVGHEPPDVAQYHAANPSFPHETTADQFFDEEQWESYRILGSRIAEQVFDAPVRLNDGSVIDSLWDHIEHDVREQEGSEASLGV